ncbi:MAG: undecaprenyl-diphosphatase [Candidatus Nanohaloarchaeota archaeon QJJ-9]|nr:undecaprenyl-diphosphatase [Candidatus Nanohaloarchaeota archaeon QJJ-9]
MSIFTAIQSLTGNAIVDELMIICAEYLVFLVPAALVFLWLFRGEEGKSDSFFGFSSVIIGLAVAYALGMIYSHPTPYMQGFETILTEAPENSFPSQHTAVIFSLVWPLVYRKRKKLSAVVGIGAVLTGFARIYTGLHFPLDILGGVIASLVGFGITFLLEEYIDRIGEEFKMLEERFYNLLT